MTFYGNGSVWFPVGRKFLRFADGKMTTSDREEIAFLRANYESDNMGEEVRLTAEEVEQVAELADKPKRGRKRANANHDS